jgi:hypothetical protein
MTLNVQLSPQTEAKLIQQAIAAGVDPSSFVSMIVEQAISRSRLTGPAADEMPGDVREFDAALDELFRDDARALPQVSSTYSRTDIYSDHD